MRWANHSIKFEQKIGYLFISLLFLCAHEKFRQLKHTIASTPFFIETDVPEQAIGAQYNITFNHTAPNQCPYGIIYRITSWRASAFTGQSIPLIPLNEWRKGLSWPPAVPASLYWFLFGNFAQGN